MILTCLLTISLIRPLVSCFIIAFCLTEYTLLRGTVQVFNPASLAVKLHSLYIQPLAASSLQRNRYLRAISDSIISFLKLKERVSLPCSFDSFRSSIISISKVGFLVCATLSSVNANALFPIDVHLKIER